MSAKQNLITLICVILANAVGAAPSPPPNQADWQAAVAASCGVSKQVAQGQSIHFAANSIPVGDIGGKERLGRLQYLWGTRLSSSDARFSGITAIAYDDSFGLLAATDKGNWVAIDLEQGKVSDVRIAPMLGVNGKPAAMLKGLTYFVSFSDRTGVTRFDVPTCGLNARSVSVAETNAPVTSMATVAWGYSIFAGRDAVTGELIDAVKDIDLLKRSEKVVLERATDIPALSEFELTGISGPERIVPYNLISLWRPNGSRKETVIRGFSLPEWDDVMGAKGFQTESLADIPVTIAAVTGVLSDSNKGIYIFAATHAAPGEPTDILVFLWKPDRT